MAYTPDYNETTIEESAINFITKGIVAFGGLIVIVIMTVMYIWARKKGKF